MLELLDKSIIPEINDITTYVNNPLFNQFYKYVIEEFDIIPLFEFSKCSWAPGWNIKFKKGGKNLCTLYPKKGFFTVLIVIGEKDKEGFLELVHDLSQDIKNIYNDSDESRGQRWLMIDLVNEDRKYEDVKKLINLRRYSTVKII